MFKPCPNCGFLVALIAGREASQRCPRCRSAMLEEGETPPVLEADAAPRPLPAPRRHREATSQDNAPDVEPVAHDLADAPDPAVMAAAAVIDMQAPADTDIAAMAAMSTTSTAPAPAFARQRERIVGPAPRRWPLAVVIVLLTLLLALQLLLSQRVTLAADARWRPVIASMCGLLRCTVPAWREPRALRLLARDVRPDSAHPGVLHVTTTMRNDARWAQPLPVVMLSLSDLDGRVVGAVTVPPARYGRRADERLPPGEATDIAFDVREPSPHVVSFDFQLR